VAAGDAPGLLLKHEKELGESPRRRKDDTRRKGFPGETKFGGGKMELSQNAETI